AAIALHRLGRVAREVPLHNLKDTARMLKRSIPFELGSILRFTAAIFAVTSGCFGMSGLLSATIFRRSGLVQPAFGIVSFLLRLPSGEESVQIFIIFEVVAKNRRGVCVMHDVLAEFFVIS